MENNNLDNENTKVQQDIEIEENVPINENVKSEKKNKKGLKIVAIIIVLVLIAGGVLFAFKDKIFKNDNNNAQTNVKESNNKYYSDYRMSGNDLEKFDLYFLQLENEQKNKIYSPLSIKYALAMLSDGAVGDSKEQIDALIGDYVSKKYNNSSNMSFANAMFIKDSFKNEIKNDYISLINQKYNGSVVFDSFRTPNKINSWVSDKTFKLIDGLFDDVSDLDFVLVNALAIDMEWVNKIQSEHEDWYISYPHEDYFTGFSALDSQDYTPTEFSNMKKKAKTAQIGASVNKYDIVKDKGEQSIRETVTKEYQKWLDDGACGDPENEPDAKTYIEKYMKEIKSGYNQISSSTDFYFYDDNNVKAFGKDLKTYNGTTLEYVGIMPKNEELTSYINNIDVNNVNSIIKGLKPIELSSFEEGTITKIEGFIPMFKFDYELKLKNDLQKLGVVDVFDSEKANLSQLTNSKSYISKATHKANIEFSNEGIKAAAATAVGGKGSLDCYFEYKYDVPVKTIDLTFNKPYLFIIRDKDSGEVWFTGTVYEPIEYTSYYGD